MSPRLRTLLILAALAVIGVTALALLAQRYRGMIPESSVRDLEPAPIAPEPVSPEPAPPPEPAPVPRTAPETAAVRDEAEPSAAPSEADRAAVERFLEVRAAIRAFVAENRPAARKIAAALASDPGSAESAAVDPLFFAGFRLARGQALDRVGMDAAEYEKVRAAWTAWRDGDGQGGLAAALDATGEKGREAGLRGLEPLDYKLAF